MANSLANSVLKFWFGEETLTPDRINELLPFWFGSSKDVDFDIERRFGKLVSTAASGSLDSWMGDQDEALALVLLLDQFPRNLYRGTAKAFSHDEKARQVSWSIIESDAISQMHPIQALFAILPLEHSEHLPDQKRCVELTKQLALRSVGTDESWTQHWDGFISYAEKHHDLIAEFGRFPHRNNVLGRESTEQELAWLINSAERFGQ